MPHKARRAARAHVAAARRRSLAENLKWLRDNGLLRESEVGALQTLHDANLEQRADLVRSILEDGEASPVASLLAQHAKEAHPEVSLTTCWQQIIKGAIAGCAVGTTLEVGVGTVLGAIVGAIVGGIGSVVAQSQDHS